MLSSEVLEEWKFTVLHCESSHVAIFILQAGLNCNPESTPSEHHLPSSNQEFGIGIWCTQGGTMAMISFLTKNTGSPLLLKVYGTWQNVSTCFLGHVPLWQSDAQVRK